MGAKSLVHGGRRFVGEEAGRPQAVVGGPLDDLQLSEDFSGLVRLDDVDQIAKAQPGRLSGTAILAEGN